MKNFLNGPDAETHLMVAVGSAVACGCLTCLEKLTAIAHSRGVDPKKLQTAAIIGQFVKDQPATNMKTLADELLGTHLMSAKATADCPADSNAAGVAKASETYSSAAGCGCT